MGREEGCYGNHGNVKGGGGGRGGDGNKSRDTISMGRFNREGRKHPKIHPNNFRYFF